MTDSIHTPEMRALSDWLHLMRVTQGLTMRTLGQRLGKPHSYVQKVEAGERRLDVVEFVWYCRSLDVSPHVGLDIVIEGGRKRLPAGIW